MRFNVENALVCENVFLRAFIGCLLGKCATKSIRRYITALVYVGCPPPAWPVFEIIDNGLRAAAFLGNLKQVSPFLTTLTLNALLPRAFSSSSCDSSMTILSTIFICQSVVP